MRETVRSKRFVLLPPRIQLAEAKAVRGPDNQRLIRFILKKAGAEVTVAGNGRLQCHAATATRQLRPTDNRIEGSCHGR